MKKVALILSSSLRSEIYYKKIKKNDIFISKIIYYGKKKSFIKKHDLKKVTFFSCDHLDNKICKFIIKQKEKEFIISPKPGELIKNKALLKKKKLIHFHPGNLPYFKGSTVLYYTLLNKKKIYCTCFILSEKIDSGKIIFKKIFRKPKFKNELDVEKFDNNLRSETLIHYLNGSSKKIKDIKYNTINYFIIHPVLRKIAINNNHFKFIKKIFE